MKIIRSLSFVIAIVVAFGAVVWAAVRWVPIGSYPGRAFFDLAAQTIPILLVALAVEAQARRFDLEKAGKWIRIAAVVLLAFGETAALLVSASLYIPEPGVQRDLFVVIAAAGLLSGFFAVIAVAVRTTAPPEALEAPPAASAPSATDAQAPRPGSPTDRAVPEVTTWMALGGVLVGLALATVNRLR